MLRPRLTRVLRRSIARAARHLRRQKIEWLNQGLIQIAVERRGSRELEGHTEYARSTRIDKVDASISCDNGTWDSMRWEGKRRGQETGMFEERVTIDV